MKTNVSIKFNSIEEYRVIKKKLEEMGYVNDKIYNEQSIPNFEYYSGINLFVRVYEDLKFTAGIQNGTYLKTYNNLEEFLNN